MKRRFTPSSPPSSASSEDEECALLHLNFYYPLFSPFSLCLSPFLSRRPSQCSPTRAACCRRWRGTPPRRSPPPPRRHTQRTRRRRRRRGHAFLGAPMTKTKNESSPPRPSKWQAPLCGSTPLWGPVSNALRQLLSGCLSRYSEWRSLGWRKASESGGQGQQLLFSPVFAALVFSTSTSFPKTHPLSSRLSKKKPLKKKKKKKGLEDLPGPQQGHGHPRGRGRDLQERRRLGLLGRDRGQDGRVGVQGAHPDVLEGVAAARV